MQQKHTRLALLFAPLALAIGATAYAQTATLPSNGVTAVPTYEAVGLYWDNPGGSSGCQVKYRRSGDSAWSQGLDLWYDGRDGQCRGSLVNLAPGTWYQVELNLPGQGATRGIAFQTWANARPVAKTVAVGGGSGTLNITEGGSAAGYVVYEGGGAVRDAGNGSQFNVTINASYVIVRGLVLRGAQQDAIRISPDVHDVIIEDNDISGWGRTRDGKWGTDMDSGIRAICSQPSLVRVTIQRNRIHDPRYSANSWSDGHPAGPQAIAFSYCGGNHVMRHNDIYSTNGNYFNDVIGGEDNFTKIGFPNSDTDIYGNKLSNGWDDAIESEGANENVRIWGNYIDRTAIGIATTVTSVGPVYIFRNVYNRSQMYAKISSLDLDDRQVFFKSGSDSSLGDGRRYLFHNTMLQAVGSGLQYPLGAAAGVGGTGSSQPINNTWSMNNIYHLWKPKGAMYQVGSNNNFANDLYSGTPGEASYTNGMAGTPVYASGAGWQSESGGNYQLSSSSPGYGRGVRIPNFNDGSSAPDVGAHQSGTAAMRFGVSASPGSAVGGPGTVPTVPSVPSNPTPAPAPAPVSNGVNVSVSALTFDGASTRAVTYTNNTPAKITFIQAIMSSTKFGQTNNCGEVAAGASCTAMVTYYPQYGGTTSGTLTLTSTAPNSPHTISLQAATAAATPSIANVQGLWWTAAESGWGLNLAQQGDVVFGTWFTYDATGSGQWLVMSNGKRTGPNSFSGTLYRTTGPAFSDPSFSPARVTQTAVGSATLTFADVNNGTFTATVDGTTVTKAIGRMWFGATIPSCTASSSFSNTNFQDLWWRTGGIESGWGLNIAHQGDTLFLTWFTYDENGRGMWLIGSNVAKTGPGRYAGTLYRTWGPAFSVAKWNPASVTTTPVGSVSFAFSDAANGTFTYTVNGVTQSKPITRNLFSAPVTSCQ